MVTSPPTELQVGSRVVEINQYLGYDTEIVPRRLGNLLGV
jgi:hypothetical protein